MTISNLTIFMLGLNALIGIAIFAGLFFYCRHRFRRSMVPFWVGCGTFILFAMVLEAIVHNLFFATALGQTVFNTLWMYALYGGLMAGLFEETGRLAAMKLLKKKHPEQETALIYGAGHGGIEVILAMVSTMVVYMIYAVMNNSGALDPVLSSMDDANRAALQGVLASLAAGNPIALLLSPLERVSAVIFHISASVLVWQAAVKPGCTKFYLLAILLHTLLDALAVLFGSLGLPAVIVELLLLLFSCGCAGLAVRTYRRRS